MAGILSPVAPNPEDRQQEALKAEATELLNNPSLNLTQQMRLSMLNPEAHKRWVEAHSSRQNEVSDPHAAAQRGRMERALIASKNGYSGKID